MTAPLLVSRAHVAHHFDASLPPALEVDPGAVVAFETGDDAYARLARGEPPEAIKDEEYNAVTGPVLVRGAAPGDVLRIEVVDVALERAWLVWLPGHGPLGRYNDQVQVRPVRLEGGRAHLSGRLSVPLEPMIGCIGLAPGRGRGSTYEPAYRWGGNLDLRELSPGATLYLPVQVPGALLSLGDLHAAMGAGEPAWIALEAAGRATVRLGLERGMALSHPRLRVGNTTFCVAVLDKGRPLQEAGRVALEQAFELLTGEHHLDPLEAYGYACARVGLRFGGPACPIAVAVVPDPWVGEEQMATKNTKSHKKRRRE
jgi:amidase